MPRGRPLTGRLPSITLMAIGLLVVSCGAARRCAYEAGRDGWQQPERVVTALELSTGDQVADLGSGSGYFTFRLADAVGPEGRVYAVDVDAGMNAHVAKRARESGYENVVVLLARSDDPALPDAAIDLVFTSNTYHHLEDRVAYFNALRTDLAPGGRVAILDYDAPGLLRSHFTEKQEMLQEMREAGYAPVADHDFVDRQSFVVFAPTE